jgi:transcription antitermination factor NusG
MCWYVLYTAARAEKQVAARLEREGIETYLPLHKSKRKWSDRVKVVEMPLFSSYIFVHCPESQLYSLNLVAGVSRTVYYLGRPAKVHQHEIDSIKEFLLIAENGEIITSGDKVEILCGSFVKRQGKVLWSDEKMATLFLEELGAKICVELQNLGKVK